MVRYSRTSSRLCSEHGAFLTELFNTDPLVTPNFGFKPRQKAAYLDVLPDGRTQIMVHWKYRLAGDKDTEYGGAIPIPLARFFAPGNLPESRSFADLRANLGSWYNDEIINIYLNLARAKWNPARFLVFGTYYAANDTTATTAEETETRYFDRNLNKSEVEKYDKAIIPYNKGENHWVLFYVVREGGAMRIYYYDSYTEYSAHRTYRTLKALLDELYGKDTAFGARGFNPRMAVNKLCKRWNPGWKEGDDLPTTKVGFRVYQTDVINCGVFTCLAASLLMAGHRPNFLHEVALVDYVNSIHAVHDGTFENEASSSVFAQEETETHANETMLKMRMLVYNTLFSRVIPFEQPAVAASGADSDVEVIESPTEEQKVKVVPKGKGKGGARAHRFFSRRTAYSTRRHDKHRSRSKSARSRRVRLLRMP